MPLSSSLHLLCEWLPWTTIGYWSQDYRILKVWYPSWWAWEQHNTLQNLWFQFCSWSTRHNQCWSPQICSAMLWCRYHAHCPPVLGKNYPMSTFSEQLHPMSSTNCIKDLLNTFSGGWQRHVDQPELMHGVEGYRETTRSIYLWKESLTSLVSVARNMPRYAIFSLA